MKKHISLRLLILFISLTVSLNAQHKMVVPPHFKVDTRVDNMGYWQKCAALGLVPVQPMYRAVPAENTGSRVFLKGIMIQDSPDVPVETDGTSTQSENSIFVDPLSEFKVMNSNNSTPNPSTGAIYGTSTYTTSDGGATWSGTKLGPGGTNWGDPAACINLSGRWFEGFINTSSGQSVAYSDNQGSTWTRVTVANKPPGSGSMLDKNHLWVDNSPTSTFKGYLYDACTPFGGSFDSQIAVSVSTTNGTNWSSLQNISSGAGGYLNQGAHLKTGPDGEAYCTWIIYDSYPSNEKAIGFTKSVDGGSTWSTAFKAINNIKGIRNFSIGKNMRVNSFPSMAVDISNGPNRGNIYIVWANVGVPGVNSGTGVDVYMIRSTDKGDTWSDAIKVNQDPAGLGKKHFLPWVTCDQVTGTVSVVFYDDRNVGSNKCEVFLGWSTDGGTTWQDTKVSDVSFTPSPIPNMAANYMGDYLGITAFNGKTYPCWTDNRLGYCMAFVSPIDLVIPEAIVVYDDNILNDTTYGNANNKMDFGENELLGLKMNNTGSAQSDSVTVKLSSSSPYITFQDNSEFYGDFAAGEIKTIFDGYKFQVSDSIPGLQVVPFEVESHDKNDSVTVSTFELLSHGPALSINILSVSDPAPGGNNNGRLDPGETATLFIQTTNTGDHEANNVLSDLVTTNPYITITSGTYNIGTLLPGQTVNAMFNVTVNPAAYHGSAARFDNSVHGGFQRANKIFLLKIGLVVEDWETAGFQKFNWIQGGDANWIIDPVVKEEGIYSAHSGAIDPGQMSVLSLNYNALYDDSISFYCKISTNELSNYLKFYIDGSIVGLWSGSANPDWLFTSYPVLAGPHEFKWVYDKPFTAGSDEDKVWVDFIVFPPEYKVAAFAGPNGSICTGSTYQLQGIAMNYDSLAWVTSGTGSFNDPHILDPVYTPSQEDITGSSVLLTIHAFGEYNADTTSSLTLTIVPQPTASAGNEGAICAGSSFELSNSAATHAGSLLWTTSGDGIFTDNSVLHPFYTPGTLDKQTGSVNLSINITAVSPECPGVSDTMTLVIYPQATAMAGNDGEICAGNTFELSTSDATNFSSVHWITAGDGTFSDNSLLHPVYTPGTQDKQSGSVNLSMLVTPASLVCINDTDDMMLSIHANPVVNLGDDKSVYADAVVSLDATTAGATSYHWYPSGETTPVISVDTSGYGLGKQTIGVVVTNESGCSGTDTINVTFSKKPEGIENLKNISFSIYPNPGDGIFTLELRSGKKELLTLRVLNVSGETVFTMQGIEVTGSLKERIDISHLSQGTYFIELSNNKGSIIKKVEIRK